MLVKLDVYRGGDGRWKGDIRMLRGDVHDVRTMDLGVYIPSCFNTPDVP